MRKMLKILGCILLAVLLASSLVFSAGGKSSNEPKGGEKGKVSGWLGVMIADVNEKTSHKEKLESEEGAFVKEVVENSPADSAGIKEGDVIVEFMGKKISDPDDLVNAVHKTSPYTKAAIILIRGGEKKTINVIIGKNKEHKSIMHGEFPPMPEINMFGHNYFLGLKLITLNEQLGEYFKAPNNEGVLVEEVEPKSPAGKAGFKAGDVIIRIGKKSIDDVERIQRELRKHDEGDIVEFEVLRKGEKNTLKVEMEGQRSIEKNFIFPKSRIHMFRSNPFDDADLQFKFEEPRIDIDRVQKEINKAMREYRMRINEFQL